MSARVLQGTIASALLLIAAAPSARFAAPAVVSSGTVPFVFDDNRVFAELAFVRPDGRLRKALAYVDLGTPAPVLDPTLADDLRIDGTRPLTIRVGDLELNVDPSTIESGTLSWKTGADGRATTPVEAILPGGILKEYQVVFDYAARTLTIARPSTLAPAGTAVPIRLNEKTGLPSVDARIGGRPFAIALDSGSPYSWVRDDVAQEWVRANPAWNRGTGAIGEANMRTSRDGSESRALVMRVPSIGLGPLQLRNVGIVGIRPPAPPVPPAPGEPAVQGSFFDWYSRKAPEPVIGWLGGNVLKGFRVTFDFPRRMSYWQRQADVDAHDLDQVGITLERRPAGYFVAGIAEQDGWPTVQGILPGDQLLEVDGLQVSGATRGAIFGALHGKAGTVRVLKLARTGHELVVRAPTTAF